MKKECRARQCNETELLSIFELKAVMSCYLRIQQIQRPNTGDHIVDSENTMPIFIFFIFQLIFLYFICLHAPVERCHSKLTRKPDFFEIDSNLHQLSVL